MSSAGFRFATLAVSLTMTLPASGCRPVDVVPPTLKAVVIDSVARALMQAAHVQGLALAVIDGGKVAHVAAYGRRTADGAPLTTSTVMYGASLTKTAVAYLVMQLVDDGRLSLDAPLRTLLPKPLPEYPDYADLATDPRWGDITPRMMLNHTTGFANFRWLEPDKRLCIHYDPGTRYGYSGEGFYLLQLVLEEGLGLDLAAEMQRRVFGRFGMTHSSMQWRPDFRENLADGFREDGSVELHDERSGASAAGSMDTSIEDQAKLWSSIVRGDGLSASSRAELVRPQFPIASRHQFPTLDTTLGRTNADVALSAGVGLVTFESTSGPAWFKGGHNDSTGNMVICLERQRRCVVFLANDVRAERIYPALARQILGDIAMPWSWEYDWFTR